MKMIDIYTNYIIDRKKIDTLKFKISHLIIYNSNNNTHCNELYSREINTNLL